MPKAYVARSLAAALLSGAWTESAMLARARQALGRKGRWLRLLIRSLRESFPVPPDDAELVRRILGNWEFEQHWWEAPDALVRKLYLTPAKMVARPGWDVPALATPGALAEHLAIPLGQLDGLADCQFREGRRPPGPLANYVYRWLHGKSRKVRLLEMPKSRLKAVQRRLLHELLARIPCHEAVHSYRAGRSVASYAAPHAGQAIVLRFDLRDFFPSIHRGRVHAIFRVAGYPRAVARLLTGLCTNVVPIEVLDEAASDHATRLCFRTPHLPQGAPTSPALANLCAYRLDRRLTGLARRVGAVYTRYADDLAFSGGAELERCARRFQIMVARITLEEGWELHYQKSRFMRQGVCQQLAGIVVNVRPSLRRQEYDRLKAILHNCQRLGAATQNQDGRPDFRAFLAGKVAYWRHIHPGRGERLQRMLDEIRW